MSTENEDLEPIEPRMAQKLFLEHKSTACSKSTVQNHRYRLNPFVQWCGEEGIDNLNELSGRDLQQYRLWRKEDGNLNKLSLRMQMSTLRVFLKWAGSIEAVPQNLYDKVMVPRVRPEERKREETLDAEDAELILEYLSTYEYASKEHALFALLWQTGIRVGSAHSLDIDDVYLDENYIQLVHRPEEGTTLKNGKDGERPIALKPVVSEVLADYIQRHRKDVTDDHGRDPLFTTAHGRMHSNTMRRLAYRVTAPCYRGDECPDCADGESKCPEAVSPHSIRRGSITHFLSSDVPIDVVSDRMNVSRGVLDEHYDKRSEEVKMEQRRGYLDNI